MPLAYALEPGVLCLKYGLAQRVGPDGRIGKGKSRTLLVLFRTLVERGNRASVSSMTLLPHAARSLLTL